MASIFDNDADFVAVFVADFFNSLPLHYSRDRGSVQHDLATAIAVTIARAMRAEEENRKQQKSMERSRQAMLLSSGLS